MTAVPQNAAPSREPPPMDAGWETSQVAHVEMILKQAEEAISHVRRLLRALAWDDKGGGHSPPMVTGYVTGGASEHRPENLAESLRAELAAHPLIGAEAGGGHGHNGYHRVGGDAAEALQWEFVTRTLIRDRFRSIGHVGAGVLMRLLNAPDAFVSNEALAHAAGVRSSSNRVVKVYICRLRTAIAELGLPPTMIETGHRSYRLQADAVGPILKSLATQPRGSKRLTA